MQADADAVQKSLDHARSKAVDIDAREELMKEVQQLREQKETLQQERTALEVVDPERFEAMREAATIAKQSANRWLDNTYALKDWCRKKFPGMEDKLDKFFEEQGLTDKVEYLD